MDVEPACPVPSVSHATVQAVQTARTTTQVVDGFTVLYSRSEHALLPAPDMLVGGRPWTVGLPEPPQLLPQPQLTAIH